MSNTQEADISSPGNFVISLDFELMWGMFDKNTDGHYHKNILGVHTAVPEILKLFDTYKIRATWATVGMLMTHDKNELETMMPSKLPQYVDQNFSSYNYLKNNRLETKLHFAPDLIEKIVKADGQELASHTFSHYYCLEEQDKETDVDENFRADCLAQTKIMAKFNTSPKSIVFPRNQWTKKAIEILAETDIKTYRGNENHFLYKARRENGQTNLFLRALRLMDNYLNFSGHHNYPVNTEERPINIPASKFLRPYSKKFFFLEPIRINRIKKSMTYAAKHGGTYHLWWHPHNFGHNQKQNLRTLKKLLKHFKKLEKKYGFASKNMSDFIPESELYA